MSLYSVSFLTEGIFTGTPICEIYNLATDRFCLLDMHIYMGPAPANVVGTALGIGFPAAVGLSPIDSGTSFVSEEASGFTPTVKIATRWGTPPTSPAQFLRRLKPPSPSNSGQARFLSRTGLMAAADQSIVLWCISGSDPSAVSVGSSSLFVNMVINL